MLAGGRGLPRRRLTIAGCPMLCTMGWLGVRPPTMGVSPSHHHQDVQLRGRCGPTRHRGLALGDWQLWGGLRATGRQCIGQRSPSQPSPPPPAPRRLPHVSNSIGARSTPICPHESPLSRRFCSPKSCRKVAVLPRRGLSWAGFRLLMT